MKKNIEFFKKMLFAILGGTGEPPKQLYKQETKTLSQDKIKNETSKQETKTLSQDEKIEIKKEKLVMFDWKIINWDDKSAKIAPSFTVHEALWLPSWRIYHIPSDEEKQEIVKTAFAMEKIRGLFNVSIVIHVWIRPVSVNNPDSSHHGENYNLFIGSTSTKSAHIFGKADDFHVVGYSGPEGCAKARQIILPHLEEWDIRMEDITGSWVHIDTSKVINNRFFKP